MAFFSFRVFAIISRTNGVVKRFMKILIISRNSLVKYFKIAADKLISLLYAINGAKRV